MKKTYFALVLACMVLAPLLYMLDLAKITTNVGTVEVNIYPVASLVLMALVVLWQAVKQRNTFR